VKSKAYKQPYKVQICTSYRCKYL